jgi:hypothetical protein
LFRRTVLVAAALLATVLFCAPPAPAEHSITHHISVGPNGWNGPYDAFPLDVSDDGRSILLRTPEQLLAQDTDAQEDLYLRTGGATFLVSGPDEILDLRQFLSNDGARVVTSSRAALTPDDTDTQWDVYMWSDGQHTRLSTGSSGGNGAFSTVLRIASQDVSRVLFETDEQLTPDDTNSTQDIYEWHNGDVRLLPPDVPFDRATITLSRPTGDRIFFFAARQLTSEDADNAADIYELSADGVRLVSTGPTGGNAAMSVSPPQISADGTHAFFETQESLVPEDTDTSNDLYERSGGTTKLVSTGPAGGNGAFDVNPSPQERFGAAEPTGYQGVSDDGTRAFFFTSERLVAADTDNQRDVYMRSGSTTTLVSIGPTGGNGPYDATSDNEVLEHGTAISRDGKHAYFTTLEQLTPDDTDSDMDLYDWADGVMTMVSPPCLDAPPCDFYGSNSPGFVRASHDGSRLFFASGEHILPSYPGGAQRLYEKHQGQVTAVPGVPVGFFWMQHSLFTPDGRHVVFGSQQSLAPSDTDSQRDVYSVSVAPPGYPRPKGASPLRVPLVPAYAQCTAPNREHGPPLAFGSCSPPQQTSSFLTIGTPDANGQPAKSVSYMRFKVRRGNAATPEDEADVGIEIKINDVRRASDLSDYTGAIAAEVNLRWTDRFNGSAPGGGTDPATMVDVGLRIQVDCTATGDATIGSDCQRLTSLDALVPGAVKEQQRAVWEPGQIRIDDGGPDSDPTSTPNAPFMVQGVFVP